MKQTQQINKLPTAQEFLKGKLTYCEYKDAVQREMIAFAKLHVESALNNATFNYINAKSGYLPDVILNSYPLSNIK